MKEKECNCDACKVGIRVGDLWARQGETIIIVDVSHSDVITYVKAYHVWNNASLIIWRWALLALTKYLEDISATRRV